MEHQNVELNFKTTRFTSSDCNIPIPKQWLTLLDITPEHREVTLSLDHDRIMIERADCQPVKRVPLVGRKRIRRFALIWMEMYKNHSTIPYYFFEDFSLLGEEMADMGFDMDCGKAFEAAFPDKNVLWDNDALKEVLSQVNIEILGSAIYSKWRYWNHWSMGPMEEKDFEWFVIAFSGLAKLADNAMSED